MPESALEVRQVSKSFGDRRVLDQISFSVPTGAVFGLLGPNGAGKTTLLRILTDITRPDSGSVTLLGSPELWRVRDRMGYLPEERGLYRKQTALETLAYLAELKGLAPREARRRAEEKLVEVRMSEHGTKKIEEMSKGMQQRIQLAAAIVHDPELLILDEPFSGLDPVSQREMQDLIRAQREAGRTILLSAHQMNLVERLCDSLVMIHRGRLVLSGSLAEVKRRFSDNALLLEHRGDLPPLPGVTVEPREEAHLTARLILDDSVGAQDVLAALVAAGVEVRRFEVATPSLDEIFVQIVRGEGLPTPDESDPSEPALEAVR